jgi:cytosine/adenosine deaminase-related metal-dependent hydrolase
MAQLDLLIRNGTVVTAGDIVRCDVGVKDGRIAMLGRNLDNATETVDATDKPVLPGGIDSHVHVDEPPFYGVLNVDDFRSATTVKSWPIATFSRGEAVWRDGRPAGKPGRGRFLPCERPEMAKPLRRPVQ